MLLYTLKTLRPMTLTELAEIGGHLDLKFTKNHAKAKRVSMILARQAELAAKAPPEERREYTDPVIDVSDRPEFERLLDDADDTSSDDPASSACPRGGSRPGAGRPVGMTEEKARMNRLSETPHPVIQETVGWAYGAWARASGCPEVALTPDELEDNALALTNAGEYLGIVQKIPPWLKLFVTSFVTIVGTVRNKARVAREHAARIRQAADAERAASGSPAHTGDLRA